jgi:hypothetical protein
MVKQITVFTTVNDQGGKNLRFVIEYRFSPEWCSQNCNGTRAGFDYTSLRRVVQV